MMTQIKHTIALLVILLTAPAAMSQQIRSGGCTSGGCSLGYQSRSNSYTAPTSYGRDYSGTNYRVSDWRLNNIYPVRVPTGADADVWEDSPNNPYHNGMRDLAPYNSDYRSYLNNAVEDSFRSPLRGDYQGRGRDFEQSRDPLWDDYRDTGYRGRMADPFRFPSRDRSFGTNPYHQAPVSRDYRDGYESRFRMPLDQVDYSNGYRNFDRLQDRRPFESPGTNDFGRPANGTQPGFDPLTPALPRRDSGSEAESIFKAISARYGNPVNIRAVRSMTSTQALQLFREVSRQTDQRHLEPSSYDLRVRRGLRNLGLALENQTFTSSLGITVDSFRVDGFRTTLSRIAEQMQVASRQDAERVVQTVMQQAQNVPGLSPNIVAFEFANATVDTLDKFSALEPKEPGRGASLDLEREQKLRTAGLESEIVGIGVEIKVHDDGLLIMKALRGGPAAEAGLKSGDVITSINRRSIAGMAMGSSVDLMKGSAGSRIQLQIVRNGSRPTSVTLVRRRVRIYTVNDARLLRGSDNVAYMSLTQFGAKSTEELDQALSQLYKDGMKSLILDLRGNPGGLLNVCVDVTNRFLPCGTIVSTKGRLSSDNMLETASFTRTWSTPLVVLIDGDSASASEIFAAAVQDNRRGIVVGEKSYGKGTVQTHFPLSTINGNLRLTTARFYSPSGRPMSGQGVTPDVRVSDADGPANGDRVLNEALQIAQSQRLRDIAQAAKQCRPTSGQRQLQRNSFNTDTYDMIAPKTVIR